MKGYMSKNLSQEQILSETVNEIWDKVVTYCSNTLHHANVYGFSLMLIPEPNVKQLERLLSFIVIPTLTKLEEEYEFLPEDGLKITDIRQYCFLLKEMVKSIKDEDQDAFERVVAKLDKEPMIRS